MGCSVTVATKATFRLIAGESERSAEDEPFGHLGDAGGGPSLTDFVPYKPHTDVLVVGSAFAAPGTAVKQVIARLVVANVDKAMAVHTDRWITPQGELTYGKPFARMPLGWDRAAGGPGTNNPVGISPGVVDEWGRVRVPNLHAPGLDITTRETVVAPWNFGPIEPKWPERSSRLRPEMQQLLTPRWSEQPLPDDLDGRFFNSAPLDQRLDNPSPHLHLVLEHLHPEHVRFVTVIPAVQPEMTLVTEFGRHSFASMLDTVLIDTDRQLCTLTWRANAPLGFPDQPGQIIIDAATEGSAPWVDVKTSPRMAAVPHMGALPARFGVKTGRRRAEPAETLVGGKLNQVLASTLPFVGADHAPIKDTAPVPPSSAAPWAAEDEAAPSTARVTGTEPPAPMPPSVAAPMPPSVAAPMPPSVVATPLPMAAAAPIRPAAPAPVPAARHVADAAVQGVHAASNAAADSRTGVASRTTGTKPRRTRPRPDELIDMLWFHETAPQRVRDQTSWLSILQEDEGHRDWAVGDQAAKPLKAVQDRRHVARALARVPPLESREIAQSMQEAINEDGVFERPLMVVRGLLRMTFEPGDVCEVLAGVAKPFSGADKSLKDAVEAIEETLKTDRKSPALVIDGLVNRLRHAFVQASPSLPASYLDDAAERTLIEERRYAVRRVLGGERIRTLFTASYVAQGTRLPIPTYLPDHLTGRIPLFLEFDVRMLVESHAQQDPAESATIALSVLAIARTIPLNDGSS